MGRGRQKAKDAKIARQLKYADHGTDLRALERELVVGGPVPESVQVDVDLDEDEYEGSWGEQK